MSFIEPGQFDMIMRLRGRGISDTNVLRAMEQIPRSPFVPPDFVPQAYDEKDLPIACGQNLLAPLSVAMMCQLLGVKQGQKILHIGTGTGYTAAILAKLCTRVYTLERYKTLAVSAETVLRKHAPNAVVKHGDGRFGWRGQAPFDRILISGAVRVAPNGLLDQLKDNGRMVCVIEDQLCYIEKTGNKLKEKSVLPLKVSAIEPGKAQAI